MQSLSSVERLVEVAAILAEGILRLRLSLGAEPKMPAETAENLSAPSLENSGETRLNVSRQETSVVPKKTSRRSVISTTPTLTKSTLP
jgi:hypothetical protein